MRFAPASVRAWLAAGLLLGGLALVAPPGRAQDTGAATLASLESAFLRNFARYVTWPSAAFASERAPWRVCVLGAEHLDDTLEKTLQSRTEQGRSFAVIRGVAAQQLPTCQIAYIGYRNAATRSAALAELKRQPVLTVGDAPEFLNEGGIIRLRPGERLEMSINLDQARAASLTIPTKMLEVSRDVVENGTLRRWR
ncbi:YfiR family protein [Aquabacterium humicola]|uniref:YfiR family protein n=1 Tax=Aquabacterium humicola TaxID=3237377 RepID=UPI0025438B76|nr:YfiR family protein [Rubrivivax pictus]